MKSLCMSIAVILASAPLAAAFEYTGHSVSLSFGQFADDSDTAEATRFRGTVGFTLGQGWDVAIVTHGQSYSDTSVDIDGRMLGISAVYQVSPEAAIGVFHDCNWLSGDVSYDFHAVGAESMINLGNRASVSGYFGRYQQGDVGTEDIRILGLRGDLMVPGGIEWSIFLQRDNFASGYIQRTGIGVGYSLQGVTGVPLVVDGEFSNYRVEGGSDVNELRLKATFVFGPSRPRPTGFLGNHSVLASFPAG